MSRYRPSDLLAYLTELGAAPNKRLSQNFLTDGNILNKIVHTAAIQRGDTVLEIGPGPGALTEALIKRGAHVIAVEKDPLFASGLRKMDQVEVIEADFLALDLEKLIPSPCKVVANLPYNITTPILAKLFPLYPRITTLTLMVQKEVGERMVAKSGTKNYSRLSLFTHYFSTPRLAFTVSPNSFFPKPSVTSCVVHLTLKSPPKVTDESALFDLIRSAFNQKRKMLRSSLPFPKEKVERALHSLDLSETARPQDLSLAAFIALFEALNADNYH